MSSLTDLKTAALSAVKWNFVGQVGRQVVSFLVSILLARLIAPSEFGLLAMLFIFQEVANALVNSGLNAPLIQAQSISEDDCSTVFFFNIAVGSLCYALLVVGAPLIAAFYQQPRLVSIVAIYGTIFLIHATGNVQQALLLRELSLRKLNLISLVGVAVSGLAAVVMALRGYGVYSLLAQHISYALITNGLFWMTSSWRPAGRFSRASFQRLFGFGSTVLIVSFLDKIMATVDDLIVGRLKGAAFVGQYNRGKTTRDLPITYINSVFASLAFPLFSRIADLNDLRNAQRRFVGIASYVCAPVMVGMFLVAEPLIVVLYSEAWRPAATFLRLFCLFGLTVPLNGILVHEIMSRGDHRRLLRLEFVKKLFLVVGLGIGVYAGPVALVSALCVGHYLGLLVSVRVVAPMLETTSWDLISSALPGVVLSLLMAVPVYATQQIAWPGDVWQLLTSASVGVLTYWGLSELTGHRDYRSMRELAMEWLRGKTA